jgi:hypothetical protein
MDSAVFWICCTLLIILFYGEPSLLDTIIHNVNCQVKP